MDSRRADFDTSVDSSSQSLSAVANDLALNSFRERLLEPALLHFGWPPDQPLTLYSSADIPDRELQSCYELIRSSLKAEYRASSWGWSGKKKLKEMKEDHMRYLTVHQQLPASTDHNPASPRLLGFLSFMLTVEDDIEVVYCYEVHLVPELRGQGLGAKLMRIMEHVGKMAGVSKSMLTVFTSNPGAQNFYDRLGYTLYDEEAPAPKKRLRSRTTEEAKPTFVILAKDLD